METLSEPHLSMFSKTKFQKFKYDSIFIIGSSVTESFFLDVGSNDYSKINEFTIEPNASNLRDSCSVSHRDKLYFYGGSNHSNTIFKFDCDQSERPIRIKFDFVGGVCASNNNYLFLCFPIENKRLCYKSTSPSPKEWWEWFTYVEFTYASHDSIGLSSGKTINLIIKLKIVHYN